MSCRRDGEAELVRLGFLILPPTWTDYQCLIPLDQPCKMQIAGIFKFEN